jgi:hypothetical protein
MGLHWNGLSSTTWCYASVAKAVRLAAVPRSNLIELARLIEDTADIRERNAPITVDPKRGHRDHVQKARVEPIVERFAQAQHEDETIVDRLV